MKSDDETMKMFLGLRKEEQEQRIAMMTELFTKLEAEWKANPDNQGKPFNYKTMWNEFVTRSKSEEESKSGQAPGGE